MLPPDGSRRILDAHILGLRERNPNDPVAAALLDFLRDYDRLHEKLSAWTESWERLRNSKPTAREPGLIVRRRRRK